MTKGIERWILAQLAGVIENLLHRMLIIDSVWSFQHEVIWIC